MILCRLLCAALEVALARVQAAGAGQPDRTWR
jgi:hypothetical protein